MIFAVFDVLLFLHLYLQFYYCRTYLKFKKAGHVLALDGVYLTMKKEVISFARSKVTEGVPDIHSRSRDPDRAPLGVILFPLRSTRRGLSTKEKTKCLALPIQKLRRGSQNLKSGSRDPDHTPLGGHSCSPA